MEIKIENISFWYMSKRRKVLEDFSLQLQPDNIIGLIGRNGQGKTTLMKLLAGKNLPDKGTILYDGGFHAESCIDPFRRIPGLYGKRRCFSLQRHVYPLGRILARRESHRGAVPGSVPQKICISIH